MRLGSVLRQICFAACYNYFLEMWKFKTQCKMRFCYFYILYLYKGIYINDASFFRGTWIRQGFYDDYASKHTSTALLEQLKWRKYIPQKIHLSRGYVYMEYVHVIYIHIFFFLIGIHSMQGWTATKGMELQEKETQKD